MHSPTSHEESETMPAAARFRTLLVAAAALAAACDDTSLPYEPGSAEEPLVEESTIEEAEAVEQESPIALSAPSRWAAGYLHAGAPTAASYAPVPYLSYNRSGGAMNVTKPAGTTGRYIVTFTGLSAVLGGKSTVHVTEYGLDDTYCKPVNGRLVSDKLEVRCFRASSKAPANAAFTVVVLARQSNAFFAYAHQPTATGYPAAAAATYNPAGATTVYRSGVGVYRVVFTGLGKTIPAGVVGHVQANAVGTGKAHCIVEDWGTSQTTDLGMWVQCYSPAGAPVDSRFTVLFQLPNPHLAYVFAHEEASPSYSAYPPFAHNPSGGSITISRSGVGDYRIVWEGVDPAIVEGGTVQVTSIREGVQCKATSLFDSGVTVHCFGANGVPADAYYTALLGS
jgi:hypothetical protein